MPKMFYDFMWTFLAFLLGLIITLNLMLAEIPLETAK